jgi:hypothetical protein
LLLFWWQVICLNYQIEYSCISPASKLRCCTFQTLGCGPERQRRRLLAGMWKFAFGGISRLREQEASIFAPGYELELNWKKLNFSISNEFVFDASWPSGNFYYVWNQITYHPLKWFRCGHAGRRNKIPFERPLEHQEGFLLGVNHKRYQFTTYVLKPGANCGVVQFEVGTTF